MCFFLKEIFSSQSVKVSVCQRGEDCYEKNNQNRFTHSKVLRYLPHIKKYSRIDNLLFLQKPVKKDVLIYNRFLRSSEFDYESYEPNPRDREN